MAEGSNVLSLQILFPSGYVVEVSKLRKQLDEAHYSWWAEWKTHQDAKFKVENVRFEHVEGWNRKVFSIQSAHDANHWIWKATRVAWMSLNAGGMM